MIPLKKQKYFFKKTTKVLKKRKTSLKKRQNLHPGIVITIIQ